MDYYRSGRAGLGKQSPNAGVDENSALAADVFDHFCSATTLKSILGLHRHLCDLLKLRPTKLPHFYPKLKAKLRSWKAQALWKRLDVRAAHKCYARGRACANTRVLVIGAGPCGLRAAIEAQLLGAKVVVVEKRDRISRNNVLHLWPFVIQDLRALGAKKFFGKFCAGAIDHISIRQLQSILLKVALLLGVEFHEGVGFEGLISPTDIDAGEKHGWRAEVDPADHPVSHYEFDVLIGADGKRNTLDGFKRKEFRGKLAIAITANFINKHSEAEARVEEISGVAFIFNQKFFKDLYQDTGIDLENIVYYKDDTHYFVMTAKKHSLIDKGVILQDVPDTAKLLAPENVDRDALMQYAREAAEFSTNYQMTNLEFAVNHYGRPDVAMFDFTSMYAAENASRIIERKGYRLLMCLVGDSLLEPFWPTGSGCARGFLSCLDACWAIRGLGAGVSAPLEVLAERESTYRLLGQTTPENLQRDYSSYTLCPSTRYPNLNRFLVTPAQVRYLYDTDNVDKIESSKTSPQEAHVTSPEIYKKRRRRDMQIHPDTLLHWIHKQVSGHASLKMENITESFKNGLALCAIIHRYRPELIDFNSLKPENIAENNQLAFDLLEKEMGIPPVMTGIEMAQCSTPDRLAMLTYLTQIYEMFHGEIPQTSKQPKIDLREFKKEYPQTKLKISAADWKQKAAAISTPNQQRLSGKHTTRTCHASSVERRRKRRSADKAAEERENEIALNRSDRMSRRRQQRKNNTEQFYKSLYMLHTNAKYDENSGPFEDYSIYLYRQAAPNFGDRVKDLEQKLLYPDREQRFQDLRRGSADENFSGRIKNIEHKLKHRTGVQADKKPPDLLRAIGRIESSDWNVREIEKKIMENKLGKNKTTQDKEKVPKWSREQFLARQTKMERKAALERTDSLNEKYAETDKSLKILDQKLKEGTALDQGTRGNNKVAVMAEQFNRKPVETDPKSVPLQKTGSRAAVVLPTQGGSEMCHFCGTRVYLMERLSAEGQFFHRGCFRCQYCSITLRLGFYSFDAQNGQKFYCPQHVGMQGKTRLPEKSKVTTNKSLKDTPDAKAPLAKDQTPERIAFSNLTDSAHIVSESEDPLSQMDEDEWTDRNFGQSAAEADSSDISDSDSDDLYEEAMERAMPLDGGGAGNIIPGRQSAGKLLNGDTPTSDNWDTSSDDDASESATEDEEDIRVAREMRQREVRVQAPLVPPDTDTTGSDTEIASGEESESYGESQDSATEISTDSEFKLDEMTPTMEIPPITLNDVFITSTRGNYHTPRKVRIKLKNNVHEKNGFTEDKPSVDDIQLDITPIVPDIATLTTTKNLTNPPKGFYFLNRTHSTEGIASKVSLELKKQYLLGNSHLYNNIQKSGSASTLDSKLKSFHSNISEHQKLLNSSPSISPTMQAFLVGTSKLRTPLSPTQLKEETKSELSDKCRNSSLHKSDSENDANSPKIVRSTDSPSAGISTQSNLKSVSEKVSSQTDDTTVKTVKKSTDDNQLRPRSPAQETSIVVPDVSWPRDTNVNNYSDDDDDDVDTDSLSSFDENHSYEKQYHELSHSSSTANNITVPKLKINDGSEDQEDMAMDSLLIIDEGQKTTPVEPANVTAQNNQDIWKSSTSESKRNCSKNEPKFLNQPKQLDSSPVKLLDLHNFTELKVCKSSSDLSVSSSDSNRDITATALTETELSDWARDGTVSDDLEDVEFKIDPDFDVSRKHKKPKFMHKLNNPSAVNTHFVKLGDLDDVGHVCGKENDNRNICYDKTNFAPPVALSHIADLDSIEFMDTASEESGFDNLASATNVAMLKNQGYVQFVNVSPHNFKDSKLTSDSSQIKSSSSSNSVPRSIGTSSKKDSVKSDIASKPQDISPVNLKMPSFSQINHESKSDMVRTISTNKLSSMDNVNAKDFDKTELQNSSPSNENSDAYADHVTSLQYKITKFRNVKDSIEITKSKSKSKFSPSAKENISLKTLDIVSSAPSINPITPTLTTSEKLKEITKERTKQKNLIHEMVMDKLKTEKKLHSGRKSKNTPEKVDSYCSRLNDDGTSSISKERKIIADSKSFILQKSPTDTEIIKKFPVYAIPQKIGILHPRTLDFVTTLSKDQIESHNVDSPKPLHPIVKRKTPERTEIQTSKSENHHVNNDRSIRYSVAFERDINTEDTHFQRSSSINENLMFTIKNTPSCEHISSVSSDISHSTKKPNRTKSFSEISRDARLGIQKSFSGNVISDLMRKSKDRDVYCKSEPCLAENVKKNSEKKNGEKRKSIIQAVTDFFHKRKDNDSTLRSSRSNSSPGDSSSKDRFSLFRISPKNREKSKEKPLRRESTSSVVTKISRRSRSSSVEIAPPIPPPPLEYVLHAHRTADDSLSDTDLRAASRTWSTDTLDFSESGTNLDRDQRRHMRRSQHKRLRIAQEIQRKLEETEVKTRELETRGVELEKVLRGEEVVSMFSGQDDTGLLAEWLTLMRELAALRRYERELLARAEDLRLEERHSLLSVKLRSSTGSQKTPPEELAEGVIVEQMLDIVEKRESLASMLERNQQRYVKEDQDLEALILAKGLQLTSIKKTPTK